MAIRRGKRWTASGYSKAVGRKVHLGTFETRREAVRVEADWKLRTRQTGQETCGAFAERWMRDYPRPRESTRRTHAEHARRFARDFADVKLTDVDRPAARAWAIQHKSDLPAIRAMFADAVRDGLVDAAFTVSGPRDRLEFLDALRDWAEERATVLRLEKR